MSATSSSPSVACSAPPTLREQQKQATRERILSAAMGSLMDVGVARTTTLEVQRRAEVSRGALLHHFPTHADLMHAVIEALVRRNEQVVARRLRRPSQERDPVLRALNTLADSVGEPSFMAEIELWLVARTDSELRSALVAAERLVLADRQRVLDQIFAPLRGAPTYELVVNTSLEFVRGLAVSGVLRSNPASREQLVQQWAWAMKQLLALEPGQVASCPGGRAKKGFALADTAGQAGV